MKQTDDIECPAWALAKQHDELAQQQLVKDDDDGGERLYELLEAASHVSARSLQGAAFQIMCARAEVDMTGNADAPDVRETSKRRVLRLLDGAMRGLSDQ